LKILKLKDFEGRVHQAVGMCDPPKGGQDTGVGRLASVSHVVRSLFRTQKNKHANERIELAQFHKYFGQF
jgi:hypothetical protein